MAWRRDQLLLKFPGERRKVFLVPKKQETFPMKIQAKNALPLAEEKLCPRKGKSYLLTGDRYPMLSTRCQGIKGFKGSSFLPLLIKWKARTNREK